MSWLQLSKQRPHSMGVLALACGLSLVAGCRNHDFPEYAANYREFAYVSNGGGNTVSVLDVVNVRVDRQIQVGVNPTGVTANPKRNEIYVVNTGNPQGARGSRSGMGGAAKGTNGAIGANGANWNNGDSGSNGSVSVIDTEKNAVVATIPVHRQPYFLEVDPTGKRAYVANSGSNSVSVIDLEARREIALVGTGEGPGLARISPDGKTLVVSNRIGNSVSIFDVPENRAGVPAVPRVRKVIEGCPGATDAVILPDSEKAFVACSDGHQVMVIALARVADSRTAARQDSLETLLDVGRSPVELALKPDGGELFVSNYDSDSISEIVTSTDDVGGAYLMGSKPVRGLVSSDNAKLYVSNFRSQDISVYSIDDGKRTGSVAVGDGPDAMALTAQGHLLFVVDARSGDVAVVRTSTLSLFTLLPTGKQPNAIAVKSFKVE